MRKEHVAYGVASTKLILTGYDEKYFRVKKRENECVCVV